MTARRKLYIAAVPTLLFVGLIVAAWIARDYFGVHLISTQLHFARPWMAVVVVLPIVSWAAVHRFIDAKHPRLLLSRSPPATWTPTLRSTVLELPDAMRVAALLLLTVALIGPQSIQAKHESEVSGIDILLTLDASLSMQASDIAPNRFEATKIVVDDFIRRRESDRIGCVIFGRDAYTLLPLTTDHDVLRNMIQELRLGMVDGRGTAIGNAVGVSLNRLRKSTATSKVIILLTDGDSNSGNVAPEQAATYAKQLDVKVYAILMGTPRSNQNQRGANIFGSPTDRNTFPVNPDLLRSMASQTGGEFFEVEDRTSLERSFHVILDRLERSKIEDKGKTYSELFPAFLAPALLLLILEFVLRTTWLRVWP